MPEALFFNVPGHGHVNPSLPVVAELSRRGHRITCFVTEGYRAEFRAYSIIHDDYFDAQGLSGSVPQRVALALMTSSAEILPELLEIARAEQPDYILFDGMCPWGSMVAHILRLPSIASLALSPMVSMPPGALLKLLPVFLPLIFKDFRTGLEANQLAKALTRQYHLPPLGLMGIMNNLGDLSLSYTSAEFQPYSDTVSRSVRFVGWTLNVAPAEGQFSFERVQGRRLIYVSLGTVNNDDETFFKTCIDAFAGTENFVIMTTGRRISPESFGALPDNIAIYE